jgi:hypothetical protein
LTGKQGFEKTVSRLDDKGFIVVDVSILFQDLNMFSRSIIDIYLNFNEWGEGADYLE